MWTSEPLPPVAVMGRRRSICSLEEEGRDAAVFATPEPSPVLAYFQSSGHLVRRVDARASRLAVDAVRVEAGPGETELVWSATSSPAAESRVTAPRPSTQARPLRNHSANVTTPTTITTTQTTRDAPAKPPPTPSSRHASPRTHAVIDRIRSTGCSTRSLLSLVALWTGSVAHPFSGCDDSKPSEPGQRVPPADQQRILAGRERSVRYRGHRSRRRRATSARSPAGARAPRTRPPPPAGDRTGSAAASPGR